MAAKRTTKHRSAPVRTTRSHQAAPGTSRQHPAPQGATRSHQEGAGRPLHLRLDQATLDRLDRFAGRFSLPGRPAARSDLIRGVLLAGLDALEASP